MDVFRESTGRKSGRQDSRDFGITVGQFWEHRSWGGFGASFSSLPLSLHSRWPSPAPPGGITSVLFTTEHSEQCSVHRRCSTNISVMSK